MTHQRAHLLPSRQGFAASAFLALLLSAGVSHAQPAEGTGAPGSAQGSMSNAARVIDLRSTSQPTQKSLLLQRPVANSLQGAELLIPSSVDDATREELKKSWELLKKGCPECSTGGEPGGPVVTGGNGPCPEENPPPPLFGSADTVTIPRSEYQRLLELSKVPRTTGADTR